jgi:hypothetical protein
MLARLVTVAVVRAPAAAAASAPAWTKHVPVESLVEWRRRIHRNPELSHHETQTADYVAGVLRDLGGIEVERPTPNSVLGVRRGAKPGRTVAFRADLDAVRVRTIADEVVKAYGATSTLDYVSGPPRSRTTLRWWTWRARARSGRRCRSCSIPWPAVRDRCGGRRPEPA